MIGAIFITSRKRITSPEESSRKRYVQENRNMAQSVLVLCLVEKQHKSTFLGRSNKDRLAKEMLLKLMQAKRNLKSQWANILKSTHYIDSIQQGSAAKAVVKVLKINSIMEYTSFHKPPFNH